MKVLMLCGYFAKENEQEVIDNARAAVEFSANIFQHKLINGFRSINCDFSVISAPLRVVPSPMFQTNVRLFPSSASMSLDAPLARNVMSAPDSREPA